MTVVPLLGKVKKSLITNSGEARGNQRRMLPAKLKRLGRKPKSQRDYVGSQKAKETGKRTSTHSQREGALNPSFSGRSVERRQKQFHVKFYFFSVKAKALGRIFD